MGKASSSKKVARAAAAAGRPGVKSRNWLWPVGLGLIVVLGVGLIVVSRSGISADTEAPRLGDHWHAAYGVYVCDSFMPPLSDLGADRLGIHTHTDGLIHLHPFSTAAAGQRATLSVFADQVGMSVADDRIEVAGLSFENGDDCDGEPGVVQVKVWENPLDEEGRLLSGDFARHRPQDNEILTIAFAPEGADIPRPPSAPQLADPLAGEEGRPLLPINDPEAGFIDPADPADPADDPDPDPDADPDADPDQ